MLISLQSHAEVLSILDSHPAVPLGVDEQGNVSIERPLRDDERLFVVSVSSQVRASLAATYGLSSRQAGHMIDQFLRGSQGLRSGGKHGNGFTYVIDTDVVRELVLALTAEEVRETLDSTSTTTVGDSKSTPPKKPILSSACPGWICYVEKTHPHVLPHLSRLKSPQALSGTLLKTVLSSKLGIRPSQIWHLAIMPCFDKKLEASREELTDQAWQPEGSQDTAVRDVDCVITSRELLMLASSRSVSLPSLPLKPVTAEYAPRFPDPTIESFLFSRDRSSKHTSAFGTSGGYLYYVMSSYQAQHPGSKLHVQRGRNADVVDYTLVSQSGATILKAGRYYGFRNIQNLVRKLKPAQTSRLPGAVANRRAAASASGVSAGLDYAYVEVMACPGGCTNGGGQIRLDDARQANVSLAQQQEQQQPSAVEGQPPQKATPHEQRAWLARVDEAYFSAGSDSDSDSETAGSAKSFTDMEACVRGLLRHWSELTGIDMDKLVYTTYRKVESDVGKNKSAGDTARVAELAGKIGGGW